MKFAPDVLGCVGNTPLIRLNRVTRGCAATVLGKLESTNPGGSVKDRIGLAMVEDAERQGLLKPGGMIVECTSGNTGVGLAIVAAVKGYRAVFVMPDKVSEEKRQLLRAYGAQVVICPTAVPPDSPESYYEVAKRIHRETPGACLTNQYHNMANPEAHYRSTGPEIWEQTGGQVTHLVGGMGTGGTISGTARYLKEKNPRVKVVGADPEGSILCEYFYKKTMGEARPYKVEGIGEDFLPGALDFNMLDDILTVSDRESLNMARRVSREEGILVGGSCGTAVVAALRIAAKGTKDDLIVVILPDTGERYLSKVHSDDWMRENRMLDPDTVLVDQVIRGKRLSVPQLVTVQSGHPLSEALHLIQQYDISLVPVMKNGQVVGTLNDADVLGAALEDLESLHRPVDSVMTDPLPRIARDASLTEAKRMLARRTPALLVTDQSDVVGILTRFDIIEYEAA
ncbi:MAG: cystathionine beta-synthase [Candidatus Eisenbacteria bacterium]|nr:cystathionine beta-synthase [Candidatus Eisenbacteria bacterium]